MRTTLRLRLLLGLFGLSLQMACGSAAVGTSTGNPTLFPTKLAIASPFDTDVENGSPPALVTFPAQATPIATGYADATAQINQLLNGTEAADCRFDAALFLASHRNASCYGPQIPYENHPDANPGDPNGDGTFPTGDVGFWTETDAATGHACAAAQLNARLEVLHDRSLAALMGLASLVCAANVNGIPLPDDSTRDLTSEMNALGVPAVAFTSATITESDTAEGEQWSYELELTYTRGSEEFKIVAALVHLPGASEEIYHGRLSYRINDTIDPAGGCPSTEQTFNGSLLYNQTSDELQAEARGALFCGHDSVGTTEGVVDPSLKQDPLSMPEGWANSFDIFTARFDTDSLVGDYAYSWQAGAQDRYTRVLNATVTEEGGDFAGDAFYGFGDDIAATDGAITGFFCNWAGPQGSEQQKEASFRNLAQFQSMTLNEATGKFDVVTSNITYAPIYACDYDGTSDFRFDSDADGSIDTDPSAPITNDLVELVDTNADGVFDIFEASGFALPEAPPNF